jgi:uncharacterized cupredoxin-like copper-binding protein
VSRTAAREGRMRVELIRVRVVAVGLIGVALVLGATACGGTPVELEMHDNYFEPQGIAGDAGETITIELKNEGRAKHNFSVALLGIDKDVEPGESAEVEVKMPGRAALHVLRRQVPQRLLLLGHDRSFPTI